MVSTVFPAEYGHSAGGMLSATYKSGTNRLHFEGEDRYVNNAMLHRAYFNLGNAPFSLSRAVEPGERAGVPAEDLQRQEPDFLSVRLVDASRNDTISRSSPPSPPRMS